ncbi:MAG: uncharacterized membrane protein YbjE (DUF340 family) [Francisella sp.]|jgi:uncharacterized membrane protein YbjE (DUF340 family)
MFESLILFVGLLIGHYFFRFKNPAKYFKLANRSLDIIVILIIFMMGYNFSIFTQINSIIFEVMGLSLIYITILFITNIFGVRLFLKITKAKKFNTPKQKKSHENKFVNFLMVVIQSSKYIAYLVLGYILGEIFNLNITHIIDNCVFILLFGLMLIIGILLRLENITILEIFKNRFALLIVTVIIFTSIVSAIIVGLCLNIPLKESIMVSSGLGWYSLSAILNTEFIGKYYGMVTFLVDFAREIIVIAAIPVLRNILNVELVGYAANTAMDFSLPVIKDNYGTKMVPLAISIGLIFTIITPAILVIENIVL